MLALAQADRTTRVPRSTLTLAEGVTAATSDKPDRAAPIRTESFEGKPENLALALSP